MHQKVGLWASSPRVTSRRLVLAAGLAMIGGGAVSSCTAVTDGRPESDRTASGASSIQPSPSRQADDPALLRAATAVATVSAYAETAQQTHQDGAPAVRRTLGAHVEMLTAHRALLDGLLDAPATPETPVIANSPMAALDELLRREQLLIDTVRTAAVAASDGALARAYASLAAALLQRQPRARDLLDPARIPPPTATAWTPSDTAAVTDALVRIHRLLWLAGVVGARSSASQRPRDYAMITAWYADLRAERDQLVGLLAESGAAPVAARASYPLTTRDRTVDGSLASARSLNTEAMQLHAWLVAATTPAARGVAVAALEYDAVRALALRGTPENFPGAGELADRVRASGAPLASD